METTQYYEYKANHSKVWRLYVNICIFKLLPLNFAQSALVAKSVKTFDILLL